MDSKEKLVLVHVPALVGVLFRAEKDKGAPLTESEVLSIRDKGACIAMPRDVAAQVADKRGYADIDPERAWEEWQIARRELAASDDQISS